VRLSERARRRIAAPVAELARDGFAPSRTVLLARLLQELAVVLEQFQCGGFAPLREEWVARHAWQGRRVALKIADRCVAEGRAVGVAEDGALLLLSRTGLQSFHAGELSLRQA
jgi:BirA family biotin operon repressor/biotin-[acetyl-CoA-carboxylase] ligase